MTGIEELSYACSENTQPFFCLQLLYTTKVSCVTPVGPYLGYECQDLLGVLKKELSKVNLLPTFILSFMLKQQVERERTDFNKSYLLFEFQGGHSTEFKGGIFFCL